MYATVHIARIIYFLRMVRTYGTIMHHFIHVIFLLSLLHILPSLILKIVQLDKIY